MTVRKFQMLPKTAVQVARPNLGLDSRKLLLAFALIGSVSIVYYAMHAPPACRSEWIRLKLSSSSDSKVAHPPGAGPNTTAAVAAKRTIFDFSLASIDELAARIQQNVNRTVDCNALPYGVGWGMHTLCAPPNLTQPCYFYSFGIARDYSFDTAVAQKLGCYGFLADPTTVHPAKLGDKLTFHYMAAKSYHQADNQQWMFYTSMPNLRRFLGHERVTALKMDCEGCEYSLARDILEEDPTFLDHIDQFAVEVHYSRKWLRGKDELQSFAALLWLLKESGLELIETSNTVCILTDQATGLVPELVERSVQMALNGPDGESIDAVDIATRPAPVEDSNKCRQSIDIIRVKTSLLSVVLGSLLQLSQLRAAKNLMCDTGVREWFQKACPASVWPRS